MRLLLAADSTLPPGHDLDPATLAGLYAAPAGPWLRANFVSSVDGAATGGDGRSGSINNAADGIVFDLLRRQADAVLVGAGTLRAEGYSRLADSTGRPLPLVVVSDSGRVPDRLLAPQDGRGEVLLLSRERADAGALAQAADALGADRVLRCGADEVDLGAGLAVLRERGLDGLLTEGGPRLMASLLAAGLVDELCLSVAPLLVGGIHPRITTGPPLDTPLEPVLLVEQDGTVMGRWRVVR